MPSALPANAVARLLAVVLALAALDLAFARSAALEAEGLPATAAVLLVVAGASAVALIVLAAEPRLLLRPRVPFLRELDAARPMHVAAAALLMVAVFAIVGLGVFVDPAHGIESYLRHGTPPGALDGLDREDVVAGLAWNLLVLVVPALAWEAARTGTLDGALAALGLPGERPARAVRDGVLAAAAALVILAVLGAAASLAGFEPSENLRARAIAESLDLRTALAVSLGAAASEEVFFRGFLQPRIGVARQAVVFAAVHLGFLHGLQIGVTLVLGVVLGWLYARSRSLLAPMALHFTFNLVNILGVLYGAPPTEGP